MDTRKHLIIGLPESGKTTFLAALWHVVESGEVPGSLVISEVHGMRDYLNRIRAAWLSCEELDRTKLTDEKLVSFRLRRRDFGEAVELTLPDLSGESFRLQWDHRQWTRQFEALAAETAGALLFVHPRTIVEPARLGPAVDALVAAIADSPAEPAAAAEAAASATVPWSPALAPTQAKLVEILQFLRSGPFADRTLPVAVVVSA